VSYSLPYDLQSTDVSLDTFTNKLKTFLFGAYVCISATFANLGYISVIIIIIIIIIVYSHAGEW